MFGGDLDVFLTYHELCCHSFQGYARNRSFGPEDFAGPIACMEDAPAEMDPNAVITLQDLNNPSAEEASTAPWLNGDNLDIFSEDMRFGTPLVDRVCGSST